MLRYCVSSGKQHTNWIACVMGFFCKLEQHEADVSINMALDLRRITKITCSAHVTESNYIER